MVFHIARGINQTFTFKFFKHLGGIFTKNINQYIEAAAVSHSHDNFFTTIFARASYQTVQQWD